MIEPNYKLALSEIIILTKLQESYLKLVILGAGLG